MELQFDLKLRFVKEKRVILESICGITVYRKSHDSNHNFTWNASFVMIGIE